MCCVQCTDLSSASTIRVVVAASVKEPILSRINEMYLAPGGGESDDDSDLERNDEHDGLFFCIII